MNRQKKIQDRFSKKLKKARAKLNPSHKPKYISKAQRAILDSDQKTDKSSED